MLGLLALVALVGCATTSAKKAGSPLPSPPELTVAEADAEVKTLLQDMARTDPDNPLRDPQNLDDALAILRTDRLDLFEGGITVSAKEDTVEGQSMAAQIRLAQADAEALVSALLADLVGRSWRELQTLEASGKTDAETTEEIEAIRAEVDSIQRRIVSLRYVALEHLAQGTALAAQVAEKWPENYLGHRVSGDAYRMNADWAKFDEALTKIEAHNPDSNGLRFIKGAAAFKRAGDSAKAATFLNEAIAKDPKFNRARAYLILVLTDPAARWAAYQDFAQRAPHHQLVFFAGDLIKASYDRWRKRHPEAPAPAEAAPAEAAPAEAAPAEGEAAAPAEGEAAAPAEGEAAAPAVGEAAPAEGETAAPAEGEAAPESE